MKVEKFGLRPLPCGVGFRHLGNYQILGNTLSRFSISSTSISHWNLHLSLRQHNHSWPSLDRKFPHVGIMFTMIEPSFKNSVLKGKIGCLLALLMASQITHLHRVGFVLHYEGMAHFNSSWAFSVVRSLSSLCWFALSLVEGSSNPHALIPCKRLACVSSWINNTVI